MNNGLKIEQQLGSNPFKYGLVSGSDAHTGLTAVEEDNFFCKSSAASRGRTDGMKTL